MRLTTHSKVVFHRYFGRIGVTLSREPQGDRFGEIGSKGIGFHLYIWRNPPRA